MTRVRRAVWPWFLLLLLIAALLAAILIVSQPSFSAPYRAARAAALLGYAFIFFAIVSTNYVQPLVRRFGRRFVALHHWVALAGLVLITMHPLVLAAAGGGLAVFVPDVSSWRGFWTYAGRPAWFLLLLAVTAAGLRDRLKNGWRIVHGLTYVAFGMGAVHAVMLGTSFVSSPLARGVLFALVILATAVLARRRYQDWRGARARSRRRTQ